MSEPLAYTGLTLDRAGARRADDQWLTGLRKTAKAVALWRDHCLVRAEQPVWTDVPEDPKNTVFLGLDGETGVFAVDLSDLEEAAAAESVGADAAVDIRRLVGGLDAQGATRLAYARGLLHWNRNQRFCGACGSPARAAHGGHLRICTGCGKLLFPRIEPAVITLVEHGDRCLLGRHRGAAANAFSTLAGFVEIGESLEDAVRREVAEEAGVAVGAVEYRASQAWPFPSGLMLGFRAIAESPEIDVDRDELLEARWFTRDEVLALQEEHRVAGTGRADSIEHFLVTSWLSGS